MLGGLAAFLLLSCVGTFGLYMTIRNLGRNVNSTFATVGPSIGPVVVNPDPFHPFPPKVPVAVPVQRDPGDPRHRPPVIPAAPAPIAPGTIDGQWHLEGLAGDLLLARPHHLGPRREPGTQPFRQDPGQHHQEVRYVRMHRGDDYVIVPSDRTRLNQKLPSPRRVGWNGTADRIWGAVHLGTLT